MYRFYNFKTIITIMLIIFFWHFYYTMSNNILTVELFACVFSCKCYADADNAAAAPRICFSLPLSCHIQKYYLQTICICYIKFITQIRSIKNIIIGQQNSNKIKL